MPGKAATATEGNIQWDEEKLAQINTTIYNGRRKMPTSGVTARPSACLKTTVPTDQHGLSNRQNHLNNHPKR